MSSDEDYVLSEDWVDSPVVFRGPEHFKILLELSLQQDVLPRFDWVNLPYYVPQDVLVAGREGGAADVEPAVLEIEHFHCCLEIKCSERLVDVVIQYFLVESHLVEESLKGLIVSLTQSPVKIGR